jgi:hypothetical protein
VDVSTTALDHSYRFDTVRYGELQTGTYEGRVRVDRAIGRGSGSVCCTR